MASHRVNSASKKKKKNKMEIKDTAGGFIPLDIIEDIVLRLDAKSLMRFKCVCKSWYSLIVNQSFVKKHISRRPTTLFSHEAEFSARRRSGSSDQNNVVATYHISDEEIVGDPLIHVEGYDNGILCLSAEFTDKLYLWNPKHNEFKVIGLIGFYKGRHRFGCGLNSLTGDFKVVQVVSRRFCFEEGSQVTIYNFGSSGYKKTEKSMPKLFPSPISSCNQFIYRIDGDKYPVVLNGCLHWMLSFPQIDVDVFGIVTFDLSTEEFKLINSPKPIKLSDVENVGKFFDRLSFITWDKQRGLIDIWSMKEYGVSNSWIKQLTIDLDKYWKPLFLPNVPYPYSCVLNFSNNGDVLIQFGASYALWYDPMNNNISKLDGVDGFVPSFVESDFQIKGD